MEGVASNGHSYSDPANFHPLSGIPVLLFFIASVAGGFSTAMRLIVITQRTHPLPRGVTDLMGRSLYHANAQAASVFPLQKSDAMPV